MSAIKEKKSVKKAVLLGFAQTPKQSVFQLEKKKTSLDALRGFLDELGFASWEYNRLLAPIDGADTGKPRYFFKAKLYDDKFFSFSRGQYLVQVFFGKKKVIMSVTTTDDVQERLKIIMMNYAQVVDKEKLKQTQVLK